MLSLNYAPEAFFFVHCLSLAKYVMGAYEP